MTDPEQQPRAGELFFYTGIAAAGVRRDQVAQLRDHSHVAVDDLHSTACDPSPTAGGEVLSAAAWTYVAAAAMAAMHLVRMLMLRDRR